MEPVPTFPMPAFQLAATMNLTDGRVQVDIIDEAVSRLDGVVYVWHRPNNTPLRIGTCASPVSGRLRGFPRYINNRLSGGNSETPEWEARLWVEELESNGVLLASVHQPPLTETIAGLLRPYLDLERVLIKQFRPRLNRSGR